MRSGSHFEGVGGPGGVRRGANEPETPVEEFTSRHKERIERLDARTGGSLAEDLDDSRLIGYGVGNLRARVQGVEPEA